MPLSTDSPRTLLVTGGAGFIGSNLVRWILRRHPDVTVVTLDALTYAADVTGLASVTAGHGNAGDGRHFLVRGDVRDAPLLTRLLAGEATEPRRDRPVPPPDAVLHLAAESHVDRSITGPTAFVETNVLGTLALLEAVRRELALRPRPFRVVHVSTDEVHGSLGAAEAAFDEARALRPNNPYAASKAGADCLVRAWRETYGLPIVTVRSSNNYGPRQHPEKLIPMVITRALADAPIPIHGDGGHVRDWLHVDDHAAAIWAACTRGKLEDEAYLVGARAERSTLEVARAVLGLLGKPESLLTHVPDRPANDRRYAVDPGRAEEALGWRAEVGFEEGLARTVEWYVANQGWWRQESTAGRELASVGSGGSGQAPAPTVVARRQLRR